MPNQKYLPLAVYLKHVILGEIPIVYYWIFILYHH
jgi:hypothetical protein